MNDIAFKVSKDYTVESIEDFCSESCIDTFFTTDQDKPFEYIICTSEQDSIILFRKDKNSGDEIYTCLVNQFEVIKPKPKENKSVDVYVSATHVEYKINKHQHLGSLKRTYFFDNDHLLWQLITRKNTFGALVSYVKPVKLNKGEPVRKTKELIKEYYKVISAVTKYNQHEDAWQKVIKTMCVENRAAHILFADPFFNFTILVPGHLTDKEIKELHVGKSFNCDIHGGKEMQVSTGCTIALERKEEPF